MTYESKDKLDQIVARQNEIIARRDELVAGLKAQNEELSQLPERYHKAAEAIVENFDVVIGQEYLEVIGHIRDFEKIKDLSYWEGCPPEAVALPEENGLDTVYIMRFAPNLRMVDLDDDKERVIDRDFDYESRSHDGRHTGDPLEKLTRLYESLGIEAKIIPLPGKRAVQQLIESGKPHVKLLGFCNSCYPDGSAYIRLVAKELANNGKTVELHDIGDRSVHIFTPVGQYQQ